LVCADRNPLSVEAHIPSFQDKTGRVRSDMVPAGCWLAVRAVARFDATCSSGLQIGNTNLPSMHCSFRRVWGCCS